MAPAIPRRSKLPSAPSRICLKKRASQCGESVTAEKMKQCRWANPKLVRQVAFVESTDAGHLRHCTFVAMRDDKNASQMMRET